MKHPVLCHAIAGLVRRQTKKWFIALLIFTTQALHAQELEVPVDSALKVAYIDAAMEKKLRMFDEYSGFIEARLFLMPDSNYTLEVRYMPADRLMVFRKIMQENEVKAFRNMVTSKILAEAPGALINQEGRIHLLMATSAMGLAYYGWALPTASQVWDEKAFLGIYMLTGAAGFVGPYFLTKNRTVTHADATMSTYGMTRGVLHGILVANLLNPDAEIEPMLTYGIAASILEGGVGYLWSRKRDMESGRASLICGIGDFGFATAMGLSHVTGYFDAYNSSKLAVAGLGGSALGLAAGALLSSRTQYSSGDAIVSRTAGLLGSWLGFAGTIIAEPAGEKVVSGIATLGAIGGLALSHYMADRRDYSSGQGIMISLSTVSGGLLGLGTGYLITTGSREITKTAVAMSVAGSMAGFYLMQRYYALKRGQHKEQALKVSLNPGALAGVVPGMRHIGSGKQSLVSASLKF